MKKNIINIKQGFTLIELMVVISIIGLLASVILSSLNVANSKARDSERIQEFQQIQKALTLYYDDNGHYPTLGLATYNIIAYYNWYKMSDYLKAYIPTVPKDPVDGVQGMPPFYQNGPIPGYIYYTNKNGTNYELMGRLENGSPLSCSKNNYQEVPGIDVFGALFTPGFNTYFCPSFTKVNDNLYVIYGE